MGNLIESIHDLNRLNILNAFLQKLKNTINIKLTHFWFNYSMSLHSTTVFEIIHETSLLFGNYNDTFKYNKDEYKQI